MLDIMLHLSWEVHVLLHAGEAAAVPFGTLFWRAESVQRLLYLVYQVQVE
jgi:hypothetical protein